MVVVGQPELKRFERVMASVCAATPLVLWLANGLELRDSISAFYDIEQNQWYYFLLTVASMLFLVNSVVNEQHWYNLVLGAALAGVILFNQDDWTVIHTVSAVLFFGGNLAVIAFLSQGRWIPKWSLVGIGVAAIAAWRLGWISLFWAEAVSLVAIAAHFVLDSIEAVEYEAPPGRGEAAGRTAPRSDLPR